jgi:carboxymethylenebutenolidase
MTRGAVTLLGASVALASGCHGQAAKAGAPPESDVVVSDVSWASGSDQVPGILARPARAGRFPAVIIIHANSLREPYIGETASRLAREGFVALAVDVFHFLPRVSWQEHRQLSGELIRSRLAAEFREDRLVRDLQSAIGFVRAQRFTQAGGVGLVGFCGGGWNALLFAAQSMEVAAVVAFYAPVELADSTRRSARALAEFITVPVQLHRAADDPSVPAADVERFATAIRSRGGSIDVFTYQARHGFAATNRTGIFDEAAATMAWSRVMPFLRRNLAKPVEMRQLAPPWRRRGIEGDASDAPDGKDHGLLHRLH